MTQLWIENGEHPTLELLAPRHCERHRGRRIASYTCNYVQQVLGVIRRARATRKREIVACAFALRAELLGGSPDQRVEPVNRACQPSERVTDEIVTANVGELVQKHSATAIERPRVAFGRQDNGGSEQATCKWHLRVFAAKQARRLVQRESIRNFPERIEPVSGIERACTIDDPAHDERRVSEGCRYDE